ncbi:Uncharacterised protein [Serratia fonticola]|jgi:hypothetical protein|uniref:Uncharacterized protein n=1 Tax=Serratia fonticola TaxID=47917 RepID=A0A4U9TPV7_SERFO|nr:Uncharacterised protein [Serratia fonticola]CAI1112893.1 Uncharacterised protein [Serratia fonticola]CAI1117773.1 Uncharacterised protein [Serratia fonticola]CAI1858217.1 Uncharacterised protein [Serratia fonticola]CAI1882317.1 Uncharacterised protein [Serratia fonticola]
MKNARAGRALAKQVSEYLLFFVAQRHNQHINVYRID